MNRSLFFWMVNIPDFSVFNMSDVIIEALSCNYIHQNDKTTVSINIMQQHISLIRLNATCLSQVDEAILNVS